MATCLEYVNKVYYYIIIIIIIFNWSEVFWRNSIF